MLNVRFAKVEAIFMKAIRIFVTMSVMVGGGLFVTFLLI